jgi:hypothetical protein
MALLLPHISCPCPAVSQSGKTSQFLSLRRRCSQPWTCALENRFSSPESYTQARETYTNSFYGKNLRIFVLGRPLLTVDNWRCGINRVTDEQDRVLSIPAKWACMALLDHNISLPGRNCLPSYLQVARIGQPVQKTLILAQTSPPIKLSFSNSSIDDFRSS